MGFYMDQEVYIFALFKVAIANWHILSVVT